MLAILLPTSVFAAPLLYCVNGDGHRAVEFVHTKDRVHEEISFEHVQPVDVSHIKPHVLGSHCRDRVLLPDIAKPEACRIAAPGPQPLVVPAFRQRSESALARRCILLADALVLEAAYPDPRLVALRTVVLLN